MTQPSTTPITTFNELNSFIINTVSPTILAFTELETFGELWLLRMHRNLELLFTPNLTFRTIVNDLPTELSILTKEGGGPVIFFIKDRKIMAKSLGRVSESDFMISLEKIYPAIRQAA